MTFFSSTRQSVSLLTRHANGDARQVIKALQHAKYMSLASPEKGDGDFWLVQLLRPIDARVFDELFQGIANGLKSPNEVEGSKIALDSMWATIDYVLQHVYHPLEFIDELLVQALNRDEYFSISTETEADGQEKQEAQAQERAFKDWFSVSKTMLSARRNLENGCEPSMQLFQVLYALFGPI